MLFACTRAPWELVPQVIWMMIYVRLQTMWQLWTDGKIAEHESTSAGTSYTDLQMPQAHYKDPLRDLAAVGVRPGVRHAEAPGSGVLQFEVLVLKLIPVDGLAASAVVVREVAALAHEAGDDTVER